MSLSFYNSLTRKKEAFTSLDADRVRIYCCGPTVYNYAHIGNFRAYIFNDLLCRYLRYRGYTVQQVMNITDVDDKTIQGAQAEGTSLRAFTNHYLAEFLNDLHTLKFRNQTIFLAQRSGSTQ